MTQPGAIADLLAGSEGFSQYGLADLGDGMFSSVSIWSSRPAAEAAVENIAEWVKDNLADRIELVSHSVGDVAFLREG